MSARRAKSPPTTTGGKRGGQPTVVDVAKAAGVSPQTVSNALNQPDRVKESTLGRVKRAIKKVGYRPSYAAQALRGGTSRTIALTTLGEDEARHFDRPYFGRALNGVLSAVEARGYKALIHQALPGELDPLLDLFEEGRIDGAVVLAGVASSRDLRALSESGRPIALVDRRSTKFPCAHADYQAAMAEMVRHVAEGGARRLAYLAGQVSRERGTTPLARLKGFEEATEDLGLTRSSKIIPCPWTSAGGRDAAFEALEGKPRFDALICASDDIALGALSAARRLKVKVPRELRIVGFDASAFGETTDPPLTTVAVPFEEMAEEATLRLLDQIAHRKDHPREHRAETQLLRRKS